MKDTLTDAHFLLYTDDLKMYSKMSIHREYHLLRYQLNRFHEWFHIKYMELNVNEYHVIRF